MTKQVQQEERRRTILEVAGQQFLLYGYGRTTMSAIATAFGGSKETLWRYFPNKEVLFAAYIEYATAAFRDRLAPELDSKIPLEKALTGFAKQYIEEICSLESVELHRLAVSESARFPEVGKLFYERAPKATEGLLTEFLERQMTIGNLRRGDAGRAAKTLIQLCMMERYAVIFCIKTAADIDATGLARMSVSDFMDIYGQAYRDGS
jgi:TetR/AcrR family transcriptional repressor of mexJK operon